MGRFGWRSGYVKAQNIQSRNTDITVDGNGDGTQAVVFDKSMKSVPSVILTQQEEDITGTVNAVSVTAAGFTAQIDGSAVTADEVTVGWIAMDYTA